LNYSWSFPVYYINLDKSVARRERMELDFGRLWDLRRSPAVDGSNDTEILTLMGQANYDRIARYIKEDRSPGSINRAELGCVLSHLVTIRRAYVEDRAMAMVVEDDITPLLM
jgi:GR25 family glycosyltransferase involved in LPS biosynthesis